MSPRVKKIILLVLAVSLLFGSSRFQQSLNQDRETLGLTHAATLKDAPPLLAFTTVALGGFRGLISNFLWIRANDLQQDDKYYEAAQLANWITDLEPHFPSVWVFLAWNMTYNISIKFPDFADRWRWMQNGLGLLRDRGLVYNPDNIIIFRELAWFYQNKMGYNLDDANVYFKGEWAKEMRPFFGDDGTNFTTLVNPQTATERATQDRFIKVYKMDPRFAQEVNQKWGPLDWRLPEAHAIYWACRGLDEASRHPDKVKEEDLIQLRRVVYQSLAQAFKHGHYIANPFTTTGYVLGPNLELAQKANDSYLSLQQEETSPAQKDWYMSAYRGFLKDAVYLLYAEGHDSEAQKYYDVLRDKFPTIPLSGTPDSVATKMTMEEYAFARVQEEAGDTSQERTTAVVQGLLVRSYYDWILGRDTRSQSELNIAKGLYNNYKNKVYKVKSNIGRVGLPEFDEINQSAVNYLLDPRNSLPYAARAVLRTKLRMPAETETNTPLSTASTNETPEITVPTTSTDTNTAQ